MILAGTSIWVDHLRSCDVHLQAEFTEDAIVMHPFVAAELALGSLPNRSFILSAIDSLPKAMSANDTEVRLLIEQKSLYGRGIGYVDTHVLASAFLTPHTLL